MTRYRWDDPVAEDFIIGVFGLDPETARAFLQDRIALMKRAEFVKEAINR